VTASLEFFQNPFGEKASQSEFHDETGFTYHIFQSELSITNIVPNVVTETSDTFSWAESFSSVNLVHAWEVAFIHFNMNKSPLESIAYKFHELSVAILSHEVGAVQEILVDSWGYFKKMLLEFPHVVVGLTQTQACFQLDAISLASNTPSLTIVKVFWNY